MAPAFAWVGLALALAIMMAGAITALGSGNALKRLAAVLVAFVGVAVAMAWLDAPPFALIAAAGLAFAYGVAGIAIVVRLQEAYGGAEIAEIDSADAGDEPKEPRT